MSGSWTRYNAIGFFTTYPAQRVRLSHLPTVLGLHADTGGDTNLQFNAALLKHFKLPTDGDNVIYAESRQRREKRALLPTEVYDELHRSWTTPELTSRNRAIIALLFYASLRRSEVCKLTWGNINFIENTMAVRGAKKRVADHMDYVPLLPVGLVGRCPEGHQVVFCA